MGVGAGLYMYVVVVQKFTFAISSPDEFLCVLASRHQCHRKTETVFTVLVDEHLSARWDHFL